MIPSAKKIKTPLVVLFYFWIMVFSSNAQASIVGLGVTAKFGTTGIGADLTIPIVSNWINLRLGYNWLEFRPSLDEAGISYKANVDLETVPILVDLHPLHGNLRITAGVFYNNSQVSLTATPTGTFTIGSQTFGAGSGIALRSTIDWENKFAPYIGIGWGNAADDNFMDLPIAIGFSVDVGVFYQGSPRATLTQVSGVVVVPQAQLNAEALQLESSLNRFDFYPVATVGIHIRF